MNNKTGFYTQDELNGLGFKSIGKDVKISVNAKFYGIENISIGDNVRIDDFCILSGKITLGSHIHIAVSVCLFAGDAGITLKDFADISARGTIYACSDTFSNDALTSPVIPDQYRNVLKGEVILEKYTLLGANTTVLPGVTISEGTTIGCHSVVRKTTRPWYFYSGDSLKRLRPNDKGCIEKANAFLQEYNSH